MQDHGMKRVSKGYNDGRSAPQCWSALVVAHVITFSQQGVGEGVLHICINYKRNALVRTHDYI